MDIPVDFRGTPAAADGHPDVKETVHGYLARRFPALGGLHDDVPLLESGAIDSLGILELMTFISERFDIALDDADFDPDNLGTPARLVQFIERRRS
jgi:acyl carrier protein